MSARAVSAAPLRAYPTLLRVGFADAVAYRAEMLVWMLTTTMPLVSLALWSAVAPTAPVGRFTPARSFAAYFLATLVVRQLTGSWVVWEMNQEIRSGALSQPAAPPDPPARRLQRREPRRPPDARRADAPRGDHLARRRRARRAPPRPR